MSSVHLPNRAQSSVCSPARTSSSWASHCLPARIPTNCSLFMLIYYTFSPLIRSPRLSKYYRGYFFPLSLSPCLSLLPLPFHLFSPVAFDQTEKKKLLKLIYPLCQPSVENARRQHLNSLSCERCERLSVIIILQRENQPCVVAHLKCMQFYGTSKGVNWN